MKCLKNKSKEETKSKNHFYKSYHPESIIKLCFVCLCIRQYIHYPFIYDEKFLEKSFLYLKPNHNQQQNIQIKISLSVYAEK